MSATTSATTGRRYGLKRVCRTWERSRSARRGPTPALSDAQLLAAIRTDLPAARSSPFQGEGHRKFHARLRILDGIRVSRTRVLRVMRAQGLLSPHRGRQGEMKAHEGTIVTSAPDVMWGTDGVRVFTVGGRLGLDLRGGGPLGTPSAWAGLCARWETVSWPSSRSRKDSDDATARSRWTWPAGWRYINAILNSRLTTGWPDFCLIANFSQRPGSFYRLAKLDTALYILKRNTVIYCTLLEPIRINKLHGLSGANSRTFGG